jgi:hypothetical protein
LLPKSIGNTGGG